jgi:large subunit ribosomal protein L6
MLVDGVSASMNGRELVLEKGSNKLSQWIDPSIDVALGEGSIVFSRQSDERRYRALHGLYRSLAQNMVIGLTKGFEKKLLIVGVGFGAKLAGQAVDLNVGYANTVRVQIPDGVTVETPDSTTVLVKGYDKQKVGQVAAEIRRSRPPEPYKGKGVRYADEFVKRKSGKTVGAAG